jgi:hypothetical protein
MHPDRKRRWLVLAILLVALAITAVAGYAFWTAGGSGTGSADVGTTSSLTINQTSSVTGLRPGGTAQPLSGDFDNPNAFSVRVNTVSASLDAASLPAGCNPAWFSIVGSPATNTQDVPSGNAQGSWGGISIQLTESGTNQDACKGATVSIDYSAT